MIELIRVKNPRKTQGELDTFALERRFEFDYPEYSDVLKNLLFSYDETPKACKEILKLLKTLVEVPKGIEQKLDNQLILHGD